jgi:MFS family permease
LILLGGILLVVGMVGFAFSAQPWQFIAAMVVFTIGETFIVPAEFAMIDRIAPGHRRGSYFGAQTFAQLGGFLGPFVGSLILAHYGGRAMFLGVSLFAVLAMVIYLSAGSLRWPGTDEPADADADAPAAEGAGKVRSNAR